LVLPKQRRLTSSREFKAVFAGGRAYSHRLLVLKVLRAKGEQPGRYAFTTSAKIGKAVSRNRARRVLGEAVRLLRDRLEPCGYDAVLIARPPMREANLAEVSRVVEELFRKAGLFRTRERAEENHQNE